MQIAGQVGPSINSDGVGTQPLRQMKSGELAVTEVHGRYYEQARRGNLFYARAVSSAIAGIASSNGIGGPLLWNGSSTSLVVPIALSVTQTAVTTAASSIGFAFGSQTAAPSGTTVIDSSGSTYIGGSAPAASVYRIGTVTAIPSSFFPLLTVSTGSLTVDNQITGWFDIGGSFVVPVNTFLAVAGSVTATSMVAQIGLMWEEVPV